MRSEILFRLVAQACVLASFGVTAAAGEVQPRVNVLQHFKLDGDDGWDLLTLDSDSKRLFVSRATHVEVIDIGSGKLEGSIPYTLGVHGVALATDLRRGYTSNGRANSVTVFDLDSLKIIQEAKISGRNPDAILFEPVGKHVFTFNGASKDISVLDAMTLAQVATIPVPGKPEFAVDDGQGQIYVNIQSELGQMAVIDSRGLRQREVWPLPGCANPSGLALDRVRHRLFSVCDSKVMAVTDSQTGKQIARVPIGEGPDAAAYDPKRRIVYSSNGGGSLSVIRQDSADRYTPAASISTERSARTMALDAVTGKVYLVSAEFGPAPAPSETQPHPRPMPISGSVVILVIDAASP